MTQSVLKLTNRRDCELSVSLEPVGDWRDLPPGSSLVLALDERTEDGFDVWVNEDGALVDPLAGGAMRVIANPEDGSERNSVSAVMPSRLTQLPGDLPTRRLVIGNDTKQALQIGVTPLKVNFDVGPRDALMVEAGGSTKQSWEIDLYSDRMVLRRAAGLALRLYRRYSQGPDTIWLGKPQEIEIGGKRDVST